MEKHASARVLPTTTTKTPARALAPAGPHPQDQKKPGRVMRVRAEPFFFGVRAAKRKGKTKDAVNHHVHFFALGGALGLCCCLLHTSTSPLLPQPPARPAPTWPRSKSTLPLVVVKGRKGVSGTAACCSTLINTYRGCGASFPCSFCSARPRPFGSPGGSCGGWRR